MLGKPWAPLHAIGEAPLPTAATRSRPVFGCRTSAYFAGRHHLWATRQKILRFAMFEASRLCQDRPSSINLRQAATIMVTIWHRRASVPAQRGSDGTGTDLGVTRWDWTRSKSWEEVTPGAPIYAQPLFSQQSRESKNRRTSLAGRGVQGVRVTEARSSRPCFFLVPAVPLSPAVSPTARDRSAGRPGSDRA
jgi:hypothetical protein